MEAGDYNLTIYVIRGDFLVDVDEKLGQGKMDPFARLTLGKQVFETKPAINQGIKPQWDATFRFKYDKDDQLFIEIFDKDVGVSQPELVATGKTLISQIKAKKETDVTIPVQDSKGVSQGTIKLKFEFKAEEKKKTDTKPELKQNEKPKQGQMAPQSGNLRIHVLRGEFLNDSDESQGQGKMDPFVRLTMGTQKFDTIAAQDQGKKPVWNESFLVQQIDELKVEVFDKDEKKVDLIGSGQCFTKEIQKSKNMEQAINILDGKGKNQGKVYLKFDFLEEKLPKNVKIHVLKAEFLNDDDEKQGQGKMDPYLKLKIGGQSFETKVAENQGKKPVWNEIFQSKYDKQAELSIEAFEKDAKSSDLLGSGKCSLQEIKKSKQPEYILNVNDKKGKAAGKIYLKFEFSYDEQVGSLKNNMMMSVIKAELINDQEEKSGKGKMDPFAKISIGPSKFETKVADNMGKQPIWNEQFPFLYKKGTDEVMVEVWDKESGKNNNLIGSGKGTIKQSGEIVISLMNNQKNQGKIYLKFEGIEENKKPAPIEQASISIMRGEFFNDIDEKAGQGKMDPFVRMVAGNKKFETKVAEDQGKNPKWEETFMFPSLNDQVVIEVLDKDEKKTDGLGRAQFSLTEIKKLKKEDFTVEILDGKGQKQGKLFLKVKFGVEEQKQLSDLVIHVVKAELLNDVDEKQGDQINNIYSPIIGQGKMDPYVKLIIGQKSFETKVSENQGKNPVWNETFQVKADKELIVEIFDKDNKQSDFIGNAKCLLNDQKSRFKIEDQNIKRDVVLELKDKNGQVQGKLYLKLEFLGKKSKAIEDQDEEQSVPQYNLKVFVIKGEFQDEKFEQKGNGKMDLMTRVILGDQKHQTNVARDQGKTPIWNQQFGFEWKKTVYDSMVIEVWDKDKQSQPPDFMGSGTVNVAETKKKRRLEQQVIISKKGREFGKVYLKFEFIEKNKKQDIELDPKDPKFIESFSKSQPVALKATHFFLTDQQVQNEDRLNNSKAYKQIEQNQQVVKQKMYDPAHLINKLNKSLSPNKSATSLFLNSQKMYDPKKLNLTLSESERKTQEQKQQYSNAEDYYEYMWTQENLNMKAKYLAEQFMNKQKQDFAQKIYEKKVKIKPQKEELDDSLIAMENEYEHIKQLEEQIINRDINDYEKTRKEVALKLVDVEQEFSQLRVDQVQEKHKVYLVRQELTQKLLYIEDRINALRHSLIVERRNHHFSSNQALHNSQLELSQISIQQQFVSKWEHDPEQEKIRKEFVDRQMQEWKATKRKFKERVRLLAKEMKDDELRIKEQQDNILKAKTEAKRKEVTQYLEELKVSQQKRMKEYEEANERYQKKKAEKTLAQRYAEKDAEFIAMTLKEREDKLIEIKKQYQPFDLEQVNQHDRNFLDQLNQKEEERQQKRERRQAEWNQFRAQYFSENYRKAQDDMKLNKNPFDDQLKKAQEKLERTKKYQQLILEQFKPQKDIAKETELKFTILRGEQKPEPDFDRFKELAKKVKEKRIFEGINKKKLNQKQKLKPLNKNQLPQPPSPRAVGELYLKQNGRYNKRNLEKSKSPQKNDVKSQPVEATNGLPQSQSVAELPKLKKNYLKEMRDKKIFKSRDILHDWEKMTVEDGKLPKKQREEILIEEARKIEQIAERKQQLLKARVGADNINDEQVVDHLLVNSIKVKLLALDQRDKRK